MAYAESGGRGTSLPSRERGLKRARIEENRKTVGVAPSRERGLKRICRKQSVILLRVAPFTGAWIETSELIK